MRPTQRSSRPFALPSHCWSSHPLALLVSITILIGSLQAQPGAEPPPNAAAGNRPGEVLGQFVSITNPVDEKAYNTVSSIAKALRDRAEQEHRQAVLILQIPPGRTSLSHQVLGLAKVIAEQSSALKTVAWVPEPIRGNHGILALACNEIVMGSESSIGGLELTEADAAERAFVGKLSEARRNGKINPGLVEGLLDPQKQLIWVKSEKGIDIVSPEALNERVRAGEVIQRTVVFQEAGTGTPITSEKARELDILATHVLPADADEHDVTQKYGFSKNAIGDPEAASSVFEIVIRIDEVIDPVAHQFVNRQIERAVTAGANLIIFEIDAPQGDFYESLSLADAISQLSRRKIRTVAYVPHQATGMSATLALSCDEIYLAPQAEFGDIQIENGGWNAQAPDKLQVALTAKLTELAERKHRSPALVLAMADDKTPVYEATHKELADVRYLTEAELEKEGDKWVKGAVVPETDRQKRLVLTGERAAQLQLAETPVDDFEILKQRLGIDASRTVHIAQRTWVDSLIFVLNTTEVTVMLFLLGMVFAYMEVHFSVALFGICSLVCFTLFFWSRFLGGTAGWLEVLMFLLGIGCLALELFVLPGFGAFGIAGIGLVLFSLVLASQTFVLPASRGDLMGLAKNVGAITGSVVGVIVFGALFSRYLPNIPFFEGFVLNPPGDETVEPKLDPVFLGEQTLAQSVLERDTSLVGQTGVSLTLLRPAGKAQIGDAYIDVVSEGVFVPAGRQLEVVSVEGNVVVVRELA